MMMLYYVLLYENVRLSHMKSILVSGRKVIRHSHDILSELPIKFLLQTAERDQDRFGGLYPQLLRLCSTHFPHLCMVQDTLMSDSLEVSEDRIHCNHLSSTKGKKKKMLLLRFLISKQHFLVNCNFQFFGPFFQQVKSKSFVRRQDLIQIHLTVL